MLLNCLFALFGVVVGAVGSTCVIYRLCVLPQDYTEKDDVLDPIEINTPSYEECEAFNELFDWEELDGTDME